MLAVSLLVGSSLMKLTAHYLFLLLVLPSVATQAFAQTSQAKDSSPTIDANSSRHEDAKDFRTAGQLYEEADKYQQKKFDEFEKHHMPYDSQLAEKIQQE